MPVYVSMKSSTFDQHNDVIVATKVYIPEEVFKTLTHEQIAGLLRQSYLDGVAEAEAEEAKFANEGNGQS